MFEKIKTKLLDYVDVDESEITPDTEFLKDLKMNSYDIVSMIGELEDEFDIEIDTDELINIRTIHELSEYVKTLIED